MHTVDSADSAIRSVLCDATFALRDIALTLERVSAVLDPTMELLEASHAIHRAIILLSEWCDPTTSDRLIDV